MLQNTTVQILRFVLINLLSLFVSAWKWVLVGAQPGPLSNSMQSSWLFSQECLPLAFWLGSSWWAQGNQMAFLYRLAYFYSPIHYNSSRAITLRHGWIIYDLDFPQALQALAAGTLLYVTFFEVLPRERAKCHAGLLQYVSVLAGFVLMLTLDTMGNI
jgi:ZIP Zinc transporter